MAWRFLLQELPSGRFLHSEVPLTGVSITDTLSGPGTLAANVPFDFARLKGDDGQPLIKEWGSAIWAEADGQIVGGGIVDKAPTSGDSLSVECVGVAGQIAGQPYTAGGKVWSKEDPLEITRYIWRHWQNQEGGNLGVILDETTSPIRIGEEQYVPIDQSLSEFDTTFSDGPIRLSWYDTHDLGGMIDEYVKEGYFDYHEETAWNGARDALVHRIRLYYPRKGRRRTDLRFHLGENVHIPPETGLAEEFASQVMFLGAGEGRNKKRAFSKALPGRMRHLAVVTDDRIKRQSDAQARANKEAKKRVGVLEITSLQVIDHPHARIGTWSVGDEVRFVGQTGWVDFDMWVRIVGSTISPQSGNVAALEVKAV